MRPTEEAKHWFQKVRKNVLLAYVFLLQRAHPPHPSLYRTDSFLKSMMIYSVNTAGLSRYDGMSIYSG